MAAKLIAKKVALLRGYAYIGIKLWPLPVLKSSFAFMKEINLENLSRIAMRGLKGNELYLHHSSNLSSIFVRHKQNAYQ